MIEQNKKAIETNQMVQVKTKKWFDRKFVRSQTTTFKEGDLVLFNVKNRQKNLKPGQIHWIGPCKIILERSGQLFDLSYQMNDTCQIYYWIHPEFLKIYCGQTT